MNYNNMLEQSYCRDCIHRVSRVVSSEGLFLEDEEGNPLDLDDAEIRSEICSLLSIDLDHVVLDCSAYKPKSATDRLLFKGDDFLLN